MNEVNIKMIGPEIRAKAGDTVRLHVEFDRACWSCIHERQSRVGYTRLDDQQGGSEHTYDATIHEDTTNFIISIGDPNEGSGRPDLGMNNDIGQMWCPVVVVKDDSQPTPEPDDLGEHQFDVGLLSDLHLCVDNDGNTPGNDDDWCDEDDLVSAMTIFANDQNIKCVMACGDLIESGSPKQGTPEDDSKEFLSLYDINFWQIYGLRLFSCLGNHDFYGMYESRYGDCVMPSRFANQNSISGHNESVRDRIGEINVSGQGINGIVPGRGRIVFDTPDGKTHTSGQNDMLFFAYNAYVEMYKDAAGYTDPLAPTENRFSDEAIRCMRNYVNAHWDELKDSLSGWDHDRQGMRNAYSKLNYYLVKGNNMFVFLSLDYGDDVWQVNDKWHDRMIHARTILTLDTADPYIRRMVEYVSDTDYSDADEPYNYQYYSPNTLIWLKEIIEHNTDKKIFVFTHHYLPQKVGNSAGIPIEGDWQYADISKAGTMTSAGINRGSNCLTGIEFHFLNKLNNMYRNVVWFSGHSHLSWQVDGHVDCHDYPIVSPADGKPQYVYTKADRTPTADAAWSVSLPSLSKPRYVEGSTSSRLYEDAEITIMQIYERGIRLLGYKIRLNNQDVFDRDRPLFKTTLLLRQQ